jgi:hypothetical protein
MAVPLSRKNSGGVKWRSPDFHPEVSHYYRGFISGAEGIRTPDLRRAKAALSQLSYGPG